MDGILNILKPPGMTSFDVVAFLRGLTGVRKIGHAGTLDPMAAGVLPVCAGRATKAVEFLMEKDKIYRAEVVLGVITDTQDTTGTVLDRKKPELSDKDIIEAVTSFRGKYMQLPPMYSALRVNGKKTVPACTRRDRDGKAQERGRDIFCRGPRYQQER